MLKQTPIFMLSNVVKMNKRFFLLFLSLALSILLKAQNGFEAAVQQLLQKPDYKNSTVGISVVDLKSGERLFSMNPEKVLAPASTLKLISSAAALEILGAAYRFKTTIAYTGKIGRNGELEGNLVLLGGADPALGSEYFQDHYSDLFRNWARYIKAAGIEKVKGNLVLDASVYDTERVPDTWIWGDIGNYYGVGANAFTVYDNLFRITFSSPKKVDRPTKVTGTYPKIEGMEIQNEVLSADNNSDNAYVFGGPLDKTRIIRGTIPRNRKAFTIKGAIHQPGEIVAKEFLKALAQEGVFISGQSLYQKGDKRKFETIFVQESPTLAEIAVVLNHESVNLFAEHFLKQIAVEKEGVGKRNEAIDLVKEFYEKKGISTEYLFMEDGSGLSRFNGASPKFFTDLLASMWKNEVFINSLPNAGEGTLNRFDKNLFPGKTLQAKSGSMTRVRCYSGYLQTDSGRTLVFSFMFNNFSGSHSALIKETEQLLFLLKDSN